MAITALLQWLSSVKTSVELLSDPLGLPLNDHKMAIAASRFRSRLDKQGGIGFLFVQLFLSWWEIFPKSPQRHPLRSHLFIQNWVICSTPEPVTAEGSRIPCVAPIAPWLFPDRVWVFLLAGWRGNACGLDSHQCLPKYPPQSEKLVSEGNGPLCARPN